MCIIGHSVRHPLWDGFLEDDVVVPRDPAPVAELTRVAVVVSEEEPAEVTLPTRLDPCCEAELVAVPDPTLCTVPVPPEVSPLPEFGLVEPALL